MLEGYKVFDADAHGSLSPAMWETLPKEYAVRRPRPVDISDATGLGNYIPLVGSSKAGSNLMPSVRARSRRIPRASSCRSSGRTRAARSVPPAA